MLPALLWWWLGSGCAAARACSLRKPLLPLQVSLSSHSILQVVVELKLAQRLLQSGCTVHFGVSHGCHSFCLSRSLAPAFGAFRTQSWPLIASKSTSYTTCY